MCTHDWKKFPGSDGSGQFQLLSCLLAAGNSNAHQPNSGVPNDALNS
jgi:hypothetical protein